VWEAVRESCLMVGTVVLEAVGVTLSELDSDDGREGGALSSTGWRRGVQASAAATGEHCSSFVQMRREADLGSSRLQQRGSSRKSSQLMPIQLGSHKIEGTYRYRDARYDCLVWIACASRLAVRW
jgi:hypothetical protein